MSDYLQYWSRWEIVELPNAHLGIYIEDIISIKKAKVEGLSGSYHEVTYVDRNGQLKKSICMAREDTLKQLRSDMTFDKAKRGYEI